MLTEKETKGFEREESEKSSHRDEKISLTSNISDGDDEEVKRRDVTEKSEIESSPLTSSPMLYEEPS